MDLSDIKTLQGEGGYNGYVTNFANGSISGSEAAALNALVATVKRPGIDLKCADVGVAKGTSTAAMAFKVKELGGKVYSVDDYSEWTKHVDQWAQVKCTDIYWGNMRYLGLDKHVELIMRPSAEGSKLFEDESFDLVFIDANHHYPKVVEDINCWLPKVRKGGILCGHDCQVLSKDGTVNIRAWQDVSQVTTGYDQQDFSWHVGVVLAVGDTLPNAQLIPNTTIWWVKK